MTERTVRRKTHLLQRYQDSAADLPCETWHLSDDKSGETLCGMTTQDLEAIATLRSAVLRPCDMCRRLGRLQTPPGRLGNTAMERSAIGTVGNGPNMRPRFKYRSLLSAYCKTAPHIQSH